MQYPESEPAQRLAGIRREMEGEELSCLLVYSRQWKAECVHYLSNYRLIGPDAWVVLPLFGEPVLFLSEPGDLPRARAEGWIEDIRVLGGPRDASPLHTAAGYGGKLGVVGLETLSAWQCRTLMETFGEDVVNALPLIDRVARIKSPWEQELLRRGGALADLGFAAELKSARPGILEYELAAELDTAMRRAGADDNFQMFSAGRDLDCMHVPRDNALRENDLILAEITPFVGSFNYAAQLCRTAKLGRATAQEREKYGILVEALEAALAIIRPGLPISEIAKTQNGIIGAAGYEKYCHPPYMRSRGHNFGLGQFELTDDNGEQLREGMAMVVHPNQLIPELGYLACGETVIVTADGVERLNKMPAKLYEVEI